MSKKRRAEDAIRSVLRHELDDAIRALKAGDTARALRELDDAERKLKAAADDVHRIQEV